VELNRQDQEQLQRGYYENIVGINRFNGELWRVYAGEAKGADRAMLEELGVIRDSKDARHLELVPFSGTYFLGQPFRTNQWGMRDQEYTKARSPEVHRTVILGASYAMGWGVGDGETFEAVLEQRLNVDASRLGAPRYEVLNMAVNDYGFFQHRFMLSNGSVAAFDPDVAMVIGHQMDLVFLTDYLRQELRQGRRPDAGVDSILAVAGLTKEMGRSEALRRMEPHRAQVAKVLLQEIADLCRARGITPVFAFIPTPSPKVVLSDAPLLIEYARAAGFVIFDLREIYAGLDQRTLMVSESDVHPNKQGHRLIATHLLKAFEQHPELLRARRGVGSAP
jgi:hypothetical protein